MRRRPFRVMPGFGPSLGVTLGYFGLLVMLPLAALAWTALAAPARSWAALGDPRTIAVEVFPHPAHIRLFDLPGIFKYKKKARPWPAVLGEWERYRAALATLAHADPPLVLDARVPERVGLRGYKRWDDTLDALSCAYIAAFLWRWGSAPPHARVFGDLAEGYIMVPDRPVFTGRTSG